MTMLSKLLEQFFSIGVLIIVIIFQPEIRKFLLMIGDTTLKGRLRFLDRFINEKDESDTAFKESCEIIVDAISKMSNTKTGALIVLTNTETDQLVKTGTELNAALNSTLLQNLFFKNAPLHDGAVIVKDNTILAASTILPVSENTHLSTDLGLRHRAALGITENTTMISLVVSEENGELSYAKNGKLFRNVTQEEIKHIIKEFNSN